MQNTDNGHIITYTYEEAPTLWRFSQCDKRIRGVRGPRGSGKSSGCIVELIKRGLQQAPDPMDGIRRTRYAIIRNTYRQLLDTTIRKTFEWFPERYFGPGNFNKTEMNYVIDKFPNTEIEISFRALDREQHVANLLSLELSGGFINEAREVPKAIFDNLDLSIGRYPAKKDGGCTYPFIILDTNSPEEDSWWYNYFEVSRPDNAEQFVQPSGLSDDAENVKFLPDGYYDEAIKGKDPEWIKVYIENEYGFVREGNLIFETTWNDKMHVSTNYIMPTTNKPIVISFDFGLTPSAIIMQLNHRGILNVFREFVSDNMGVRRFANNILKPIIYTEFRNNDLVITGDPAGNGRSQVDEKTCYDELREAFPNAKIESASSDSIMSRITAIEYFLTQMSDNMIPCMQLSPDCSFLRKCFNKGYVRDDHGKPKKNQYSHPMDALGYGAMFYYDLIKRGMNDRIIIPRRQIYRAPTIAGL